VSQSPETQRWESVTGHSRVIKQTIGDQEHEVLEVSLHVYSDRFNEWRRTTTRVAIDRLEKYEWLYARAMEYLVRDVETLKPR
jgi:hypothetical protein